MEVHEDDKFKKGKSMLFSIKINKINEKNVTETMEGITQNTQPNFI